jgi:twitching motility protein PilT
MVDIIKLLQVGLSRQASDLHLSSGLPPVMRIKGEIVTLAQDSLASEQVQAMVYSVMDDGLQREFVQNLEVDFAFDLLQLARFRVNVFMQQRGIGAVFRVIPSQVLSLEQLSCPKVFQEIAAYSQGLVLVTGPSGAGKSTTLAALIDYINRTATQHILTIEDPIEFIHKSKQSLINQRELNTHTLSFTNALKSALREDPDTILIGELRDLATMRLALTAAETGHLVFATLHTASATQAIDRIIDVFPAAEKNMVRFMLAQSLRAVIAQVLLPSIHLNQGMAAFYEIMLVTAAIKNLIRENKLSQINSVIQTNQRQGMQSLDQALISGVKEGKITLDSAMHYAVDSEFICNSLT